MKDIFKLVLTAIRQTKKFFKHGPEAGSLWKSDAWDGLLEQLTSSEKYGQATGLHAMCKQVCDTTRFLDPREVKKAKSGDAAASSRKAKRKAEEVEAPSEKPQKQKKKAKVVAEFS